MIKLNLIFTVNSALFFLSGCNNYDDLIDNRHQVSSGKLSYSQIDPTNITGEIFATCSYDLKENAAQMRYALKADRDHSEDEKEPNFFRLKLPSQSASYFEPGARVRIAGTMNDDTVEVNSGLNLDDSAPSIELLESPDSSFNLIDPRTLGQKRLLVILVNYSDKSNPFSTNQAEQLAFGATNSLGAFYQRVSDNQFGISGDVVGPITISVSSNSQNAFTCVEDPTALWNEVNALVKAKGIDIESYDFRSHIFPDDVCYRPGGRGALPGKDNALTPDCATYTGCWAHELGHNLGLHHASTPDAEYGDTSSTMGSGGIVGFNAPNFIGLGWTNESQSMTIKSAVSTNFVLKSLGINASDLQIMKIDGLTKDYYISYRTTATGDDKPLDPTHVKRIAIHSWPGGSRQTMLTKLLEPGASFTDTENMLTVKYVSNADDNASVEIDFAGNTIIGPTTDSTTASTSKTKTSTTKKSKNPGTNKSSSKSETSQQGAGLNLIAASNTRRIGLSWQGIADTSAGVRYEILRNGSVIGTIQETRYSDANIGASITYTYQVKVLSADGTVISKSNEVQVALKTQKAKD